MSDFSHNPCPECGVVQQTEGPFCDNCGFRLGRLDTEPEGHRSIPRTSRGGDTDVERHAPPVPGRRPPRDANATAVEGVSAITPEMLAKSRPEPTELEGLQAISANLATRRRTPLGRSAGDIDTEAELVVASLPTERHPPISPAETSTDLPAVTAPVAVVDDDARFSGRVILIGLWLASIVGTLMFADYYLRGALSDDVAIKTEHEVEPTRIAVPAGEFRRGLSERVRASILTMCLKMSDDKSQCDQDKLLAGEFPEEEIALSAYAIDSLEVSVGDYEQCVKAGSCDPLDWKACQVYTLQGLQTSLRVPRTLQAAPIAAVCVPRDAAAAYCSWRAGRLPTHDEWERAARGTDGRVFPWGSIWDPTASNWGELDIVRMPIAGAIDGYDWVAPSGQYPDGASPIGARDMAGNVSEWVAGEPVAARGGSWTSTPFELRVTARLRLDEGARRTDVGFRCAYSE